MEQILTFFLTKSRAKKCFEQKRGKKKQGNDFDDDDQKKEKEKDDDRMRRRDAFGRKRKKKRRKSRKDGSLLKDVVAIGNFNLFFPLRVLSLYFKEPRGQRVFVKTTTENKRARTKVIAIGDVHGDEDVLRRLLFATGATDKVLGEDVKWVKERNERTVVVQAGDVVDRGKDSIGSFTFIRDIRAQVLVPGDEYDVDRRQIRLLVGNHELMAIQADYRFIAKESW